MSVCVWNCVNIVTPQRSIHCCPGISGEQRPLEGRASHVTCAAMRIFYVTTDLQVGRSFKQLLLREKKCLNMEQLVTHVPCKPSIRVCVCVFSLHEGNIVH